MLKQLWLLSRTSAIVHCLLASLLLSFFSASAYAAELPKPTGPTLLEIVGNIKHHNATIQVDGQSQMAAVFDLELLEALPAETIRTRTPWTEGVTEFTGVRVDVLLKHVGAETQHLYLQALDEYSVEIVDDPFNSYPIIVAYKKNGDYMSVRELGPLWVMYPFDDFPKLNSEQSRAHCIWQLTKIMVH